MRKSDLDFWQGMAAHYSKFMRRSAPIYAEICNHIRPHLTRDMNVLELACGTGQLSFPLSPYVRLWEATDASSKMIAEAKKQTGSSRLHFSVQDASRLPYASETFDAVVIANALHILPEPEKVLREARRVLKPGGWLFAPTFIHAGGKLASLRTWGMERTGFRVYHLWNAGEFIAYLSSHDFWVTEHTLLGGVYCLCAMWRAGSNCPEWVEGGPSALYDGGPPSDNQ